MDDSLSDGGQECNAGIFKCKNSNSFLPGLFLILYIPIFQKIEKSLFYFLVCPSVVSLSGSKCSATVSETCTVLCLDGSKAKLKCMVPDANSRNTTYIVVDGMKNCSWSWAVSNSSRLHIADNVQRKKKLLNIQQTTHARIKGTNIYKNRQANIQDLIQKTIVLRLLLQKRQQ